MWLNSWDELFTSSEATDWRKSTKEKDIILIRTALCLMCSRVQLLADVTVNVPAFSTILSGENCCFFSLIRTDVYNSGFKLSCSLNRDVMLSYLSTQLIIWQRQTGGKEISRNCLEYTCKQQWKSSLADLEIVVAVCYRWRPACCLQHDGYIACCSEEEEIIFVKGQGQLF